MAGNGGKRAGAGRKSKADEQKVNTLFTTALKRLYKKDDEGDLEAEEAKLRFIQELAASQRGQIFIAEHLFGKPKEIVHNTHEFENTLDSIKELYSGDKEA